MSDKTAFLQHFENYLEELLKPDISPLDAVIRYCVLGGGKRIRPTCVYLGALASGGDCDEEQLLRLAAGIELIHNYSLVHDDLPAMDNDDLRRGKPTAHVVFGEANAILAGDAMFCLAFEHLIRGVQIFGVGFARAATEISSACEMMTHGQAIELSGCSQKRELFDMYALKTGALILGGLRAGAIAAGATQETLAKITRYGKAVGLCFQLSDDLLDGDGAVAMLGEEVTRKELDLALADALFAAEGLNPELTDFANSMARRER